VRVHVHVDDRLRLRCRLAGVADDRQDVRDAGERATVNGVVTLSGLVSAKTEEARAVQVAKGVGGVLDVKSLLKITPS
jgi:hypothetical protein